MARPNGSSGSRSAPSSAVHRPGAPAATTISGGGPTPLADPHAPVTRPPSSTGMRLVSQAELGAGLLGELHQAFVEASAGPDRAVCGERCDAGPLELADGAVGDHAQAVDAVGVVEVDAELVERLDGTRA